MEGTTVQSGPTVVSPATAVPAPSKPSRSGRHSGAKWKKKKVTNIPALIGSSKPGLTGNVDFDGREQDMISRLALSPRAPEEVVFTGLRAEVLDAVVKIYVTHCDPNYSLPWQMKRQTQSTSSGFVVAGRRILTNAHSVEHHTVVKVKKRGSDQKHIAKVLAIGNECDIALLTVEDDEFWQDIYPLTFGALPQLQDSVVVIGYPVGGENISVTAGVVSRIEIQQYVHATCDLLGIQIDAAINSGNSGGPALNDRQEVVGIAFQTYHACDTENLGYLVAESVVDHFLKDYDKNGRYTGFCYCGFEWQRMENLDLRRSMKMREDESGILVKHVDAATDAYGKVKQGDIVTHVEGTAVSNAGTVPYRNGERISFVFLITSKFVNDPVTLHVLRDGVRQEVSYRLGDSAHPLLVPTHETRKLPEYFMIAGFVFVAFSEPYMISEYGDKYSVRAPVKLLDKLIHGHKKTRDEQVVILSQVLNAEVNLGYEYLNNMQVMKFNGVEVVNLAHLAKLTRESQEEYFRFDLENDEVVVVNRRRAEKASEDILITHGIPAASSIGELKEVHKRHKHNGKFRAPNKGKRYDRRAKGGTPKENLRDKGREKARGNAKESVKESTKESVKGTAPNDESCKEESNELLDQSNNLKDGSVNSTDTASEKLTAQPQ